LKILENFGRHEDTKPQRKIRRRLPKLTWIFWTQINADFLSHEKAQKTSAFAKASAGQAKKN
jgi:hypothetical protein